MDLEDKGSEDCLEGFYFMAKEEEKEEDFERAFEELYMDSICRPGKTRSLENNMKQSTRKKKPLKKNLDIRSWSSSIPRQGNKSFSNI